MNKCTKSQGRPGERPAKTHRTVKRGSKRSKIKKPVLQPRDNAVIRTSKEWPQLQQELRGLTHQILLDQEDDRLKISHELQNDISQTLLGIHVHLLSLKKAMKSNTTEFRSGIASTQQMVLKSARSVQRIVQENDAVQSDAHRRHDAILSSGVENQALPDPGKSKQRTSTRKTCANRDTI